MAATSVETPSPLPPHSCVPVSSPGRAALQMSNSPKPCIRQCCFSSAPPLSKPGSPQDMVTRTHPHVRSPAVTGGTMKSRSLDEKSSTPSLSHGFFGLFNAVYFSNPTPLLSLSASQNRVRLLNSPYFPRTIQPKLISCITPLVVPTVDVQCCHNEACTVSSNCRQLCKQLPCNSADLLVPKSTADLVFAKGDSTEEASACRNSSQKLSSDSVRDDVIPTSEIHSAGEDIHAAGDTLEYSTPTSDDHLRECEGETSISEEGVHLSVNNLRLKKLLSDESGYYDSAYSDVAASPCYESCDWTMRDDPGLGCDEAEEVEWDETDDEEECDLDESAEDLWRSFEECMLSPQVLKMPTKSPPPHLQLCTRTEASTGTKSVDITDASDCIRLNPCTCADDVPSRHKAAKDVTITCPSKPSGGRTNSKHVYFPEGAGLCTTHKMVVWDYAYRAARRGPWEQCARDRAHFRRRIESVAPILEPCLNRKLQCM